jgi:hypothetical protein
VIGWILEPLAACSALLLAVLLLRWLEIERANQGARYFELHFPRCLDGTAVTTYLAGLSAIRPAWFWRWLRLPTVRHQTFAVDGAVRHQLVVPRALTGAVMTHLRAALPDVRLDLSQPLNLPPLTRAAELALSSQTRPLNTEALGSVSAAVLQSLQPLRPDEQVVLQWLLTPATVPRPLRLAHGRGQRKPPVDLSSFDGYELLPHVEAMQAQQRKHAHPLFWVVGRIGVAAASRSRADYLLDRAMGAYHLLNQPGAVLRRRWSVDDRWARQRLMRGTVPLLVWPLLLNAAELAGVLGWPIEALYLPGVTLGGCRQLPPPADLPSTGCIVAQGTYPGSERPLAIAPSDRLLHLHTCGPTGAGKSSLFLSLITQDMQADRGVVVIDPKGDLVADCLERVPTHRVRDVVVLDPADDQRPVGFDLLETGTSSPELVAEQVVYIFHQLFAAFWGPRTDDVLRAALLTLMRRPGMTLAEVPLLLTNPAWRRPFVTAVQDDTVGLAPFWSAYESMKPGEQAQVISPVMNKLRATLLRSRVLHCIAQSDPKLRLETALNEQKLIFVPLRKGLLGDEAAALVGSLFVARIWQAIQSRSGLPEAQRRPVHLYIDEVQDYLRLPTSVGDMLSQARGYKLGVTVAHQHLGQLTPELRQDLLANCRSKVLFQTTAKDAAVFEREVRPYLTAEDLQGLGRFEVVCQLAIGQRVAPPATGVTLPPPPKTYHAKTAQAWSRQFYGRDRAEVEAALQARHRILPDQSAIGHRRQRGGS